MYGRGLEENHGVSGKLGKTVTKEDFEPTQKHISQGDVFWMAVPNMSNYTEKLRPCVVVSNNANNSTNAYINAVPITSHVRRTDIRSNVPLIDGRMACANKVFTIHRDFIGDRQGKLPKSDLYAILRGIIYQFNMTELF